MLKERFIVSNAWINKGKKETLKLNDAKFHLNELQKEEKIKLKENNM